MSEARPAPAADPLVRALVAAVREIAQRLGLSEWTVKTHRDEGRRRLNARTTAQAAVLVRERGSRVR